VQGFDKSSFNFPQDSYHSVPYRFLVEILSACSLFLISLQFRQKIEARESRSTVQAQAASLAAAAAPVSAAARKQRPSKPSIGPVVCVSRDHRQNEY
jgi:hypothetical protein